MSVAEGNETLRAIEQTARSGDVLGAARMADEALRGGLVHPLLLSLSAVHLETQGRFDEAVARLADALKSAPRDPALRNALAIDLGILERWPESLAHADVAVEAKPDFAPAHVNRGRAQQALGRYAAAEQSFRRALELAPTNLMAKVGLATLVIRKGGIAEARAAAIDVLKAENNYPDAVLALAQADLLESKPADAEARLRLLLADPRLGPVEGSAALQLLGDAIDAQEPTPQRTKEAFGFYATGAEARRALYSKQLSRAKAVQGVRAQAGFFERAQAWTPRRPSPNRPVAGHAFLIGFPQAAAALGEAVLARNPRAEVLLEQDLFQDAAGLDFVKLPALSDAELETHRQAYWRRAREAGATLNGKVFIDDDALNTLRLPLIATLFPDAKVLFARRDPRDTVFSCYRTRQRISAPTYELLTLRGAADFFAAAMELTLRAGEKLGVRSHAISFETLAADPEKEAKAACAFIGLDWTDAMSAAAKGMRLEKPGAWKRYAAELAPVLDTLRPWVERFGYKNDG